MVTNAFIIGWTSDFVPKFVYQLTWSADKSLAGYVNHSLSVFDVKDFEVCNRLIDWLMFLFIYFIYVLMYADIY